MLDLSTRFVTGAWENKAATFKTRESNPGKKDGHAM